MNEFSLIDAFFKKPASTRADVVFGIGDDAACLNVPPAHQLLVSTDTLVADVHFLSDWDAYDIACKAVMVNVSDIAAMAAKPCWLSLALTMPKLDSTWLQRFSQGLHASLKQFDMALIGGDTTRGPLSLTLTIHGLVPAGKAVRRSGAQPGDKIYVSGELGAAALAVTLLHRNDLSGSDKRKLMLKLQHPYPRVDLVDILQNIASAAIDISDGLSADLNHICVASKVGACLSLPAIPVHPLVQKYQRANAVNVALRGGDDYELCFTVAPQKEKQLQSLLATAGLRCYQIGVMEEKTGLYVKTAEDEVLPLTPRGYDHFI
jgi:thiamine-monophosphate kinase